MADKGHDLDEGSVECEHLSYLLNTFSILGENHHSGTKGRITLALSMGTGGSNDIGLVFVV